jgi:hypothetical protein
MRAMMLWSLPTSFTLNDGVQKRLTVGFKMMTAGHDNLGHPERRWSAELVPKIPGNIRTMLVKP